MAQLPPAEIAYQEAHINDNRSTPLIGICTFFTAIALLSLTARLISRRLGGVRLWLDDYFAIASAIPLIGLNITACLIAHYGVGRVLLYVIKDPKNFIHIGKAELAFSVFYDWSMTLGKLSVLALLARIFTLHQMWFKVAVYFWATWTILWWTAGWFIIFLECRPLSSNWGVPTQCRPAFRTSVAAAVFNTISDVGILILPQPLIWRLQLPTYKKIGISILFLFGSFAAAVSIARIPLLKGAGSSSNFNSTYDSYLPVMFTVLEPASIIICACLPLTLNIFKRIPTPKLSSYISSFTRSSNSGGDTSKGSRPSAKGASQQQTDKSENTKRPGPWTKLEESSMGSSHTQAGPFAGDEEEYELVTQGAAPAAVKHRDDVPPKGAEHWV